MFKKSSRVLLVTLLLFVLAGATYAFAASNTVPGTLAGDGVGGITGYTVSSITYTVSSGSITAVSFSLSEAAGVVQASLNGGTLVNCSATNTAFTAWTCSANVTVFDASSLRVVAVQ